MTSILCLRKAGFSIDTWMSYNTQEMSEIRVLSKIDRAALTETLS